MYRQDEPEVNLDQLLEKLRSFAKRFRLGGGGGLFTWAVFGILTFAAIVWLATGFYTVQPSEQSAMRLLGEFNSTQGPGLHWFWPAPIGTKAIVNVQEVRRLEVGLRGATPVLDESLMITGDENIVDVQLVVQYDIQQSVTTPGGEILEPIVAYLFRSKGPDGIILKSATESALRQVVGQRDIDDVLTEEKEAVQAETKELLQLLLDLYETGIRIREVKLQNVLAPTQVQDAFDDVVRAKEDKERTINLAEAYEADILPKARGEAAKTVQAAEAFKAERIANATGEASRFEQVLTEFNNSPEVTRQRLYLEAMEEILPGITKFIVAADSGGNLLQFLPLSPNEQIPALPTQPTSSQE
jgi:membrane protease subunit HflK